MDGLSRSLAALIKPTLLTPPSLQAPPCAPLVQLFTEHYVVCSRLQSRFGLCSASFTHHFEHAVCLKCSNSDCIVFTGHCTVCIVQCVVCSVQWAVSACLVCLCQPAYAYNIHCHAQLVQIHYHSCNHHHQPQHPTDWKLWINNMALGFQLSPKNLTGQLLCNACLFVWTIPCLCF